MGPGSTEELTVYYWSLFNVKKKHFETAKLSVNVGQKSLGRETRERGNGHVHIILL